MSMIGNFRTTSDPDIAALLERPARIEPLLYGADFASQQKPRGVFAIFARRKPPPADAWTPLDYGEEIDVDKAWHGIHFLLTGSAWGGTGPEAFVVAGGTEIGAVDVGYGPARAFWSDEVKAIADRLRGIDEAQLRLACDRDRLAENEIYPDIWGEATESCCGYLLRHFAVLKRFVCDAAERGKGLIVYLN